jgi:hypothetical protein
VRAHATLCVDGHPAARPRRKIECASHDTRVPRGRPRDQRDFGPARRSVRICPAGSA